MELYIHDLHIHEQFMKTRLITMTIKLLHFCLCTRLTNMTVVLISFFSFGEVVRIIFALFNSHETVAFWKKIWAKAKLKTVPCTGITNRNIEDWHQVFWSFIRNSTKWSPFKDNISTWGNLVFLAWFAKKKMPKSWLKIPITQRSKKAFFSTSQMKPIFSI